MTTKEWNDLKPGDLLFTRYDGRCHSCRLVEKEVNPINLHEDWYVEILNGGGRYMVAANRGRMSLCKSLAQNPVPNPPTAENERLREALERIKNKRASFQPSRIEDMSDDGRLRLELAAIRAFCGKALEGGE